LGADPLNTFGHNPGFHAIQRFAIPGNLVIRLGDFGGWITSVVDLLRTVAEISESRTSESSAKTSPFTSAAKKIKKKMP
jgi:hypothetical protein